VRVKLGGGSILVSGQFLGQLEVAAGTAQHHGDKVMAEGVGGDASHSPLAQSLPHPLLDDVASSGGRYWENFVSGAVVAGLQMGNCAMTVRIGQVRFDDWTSLELPGGWSDTFILRISPVDGLPPADYARLIRRLFPPVLRLRRSASLWVQACGEQGGLSGAGRWFAEGLRHALRGLPAPVAVTAGPVRPQIWDFSFFPWVDNRPSPRPPSADPYLKGRTLTPAALACLRVLARADCAYTAEVASLACRSLTAARKALRGLEARGYVRFCEGGRYPFWGLRRPGLSVALRSWGLPPGRPFPERKERGWPACKERDPSAHKVRRSSAGRHRRTSRLWPAWLRRAWPGAEVWAGWTEVACGRARPDALCWGRLDGHEALFWLEVESGNASREALQNKTLQRVNRALVYARGFRIRLVFALLGQPWVREAAVGVFRELPGDVAVVLEDWKAFGTLPSPAWGKVGWR
jgi:hypothetical protein